MQTMTSAKIRLVEICGFMLKWFYAQVRAARAACLFLLGRPIKFLICGVVVAVPVIDRC